MSYYFGIDSNTTICCSMPLDFYIGRMGFGIYPDTSYYAFNTSMASQAGFINTFGYWGILGPDANQGHSSTFYEWGIAQADAAWQAWESTFIGSALVGGYTVFGDLEEGFGGWQTPGPNEPNAISNNQDVVRGFVNELYGITPPHVYPGLYVSPGFWNTYLGGNGFVPSYPFVLWIVGVYDCLVCGPCSPCTTTIQDAEHYYSTYVQPIGIGGQHPILWQYWLTPGCDNSSCGDWDISSQLVQSLSPSTL